MSERGVVEAALFSAGKPVAVDEIAQTTGLPAEGVRNALEALGKSYRERESAIEIARIGEKWTMQIRLEYGEKAQAFAPPELPKDLLKTSALIAYYQPMKQSELVRMVGAKAYDQVRSLEGLRLITTKPSGQTLELRTGAAFPEFFGLSVNDRDEMKRVLGERIGIVESSSQGPPSSPALSDTKPEKHV